jgi:transcriptional regulator with XRE-family HTH domain
MTTSGRKGKRQAPSTPQGQLGEVLKGARLSLGLSQKDVADSLGYESAQVVSDWERGQAPLPMKQLFHLAEILKLDKDHLFELLLDFSVGKLRKNMENEFSHMKSRAGRKSR